MKKHQIYGKDLKKMFEEKRKFTKNCEKFTKKKAKNETSDPGLNLFCDFCHKVLSTTDRYE